MTEKKLTNVFGDNAGVPYAAFCLRDRYYFEMAEHVVNHGRAHLGRPLEFAVDLGCGIGVSTLVLARHAKRTLGVEPSASMRDIAQLHFVGNPKVQIREGSAETLGQGSFHGLVDLVTGCQMVHLLHSPTESRIPKLFEQVHETLLAGGVFAFDLGPSNYKFAMPIADFRAGSETKGSVPSEFSHPLYQRAERLVHELIRKEKPELDLPEKLWASPAAQMDFDFLAESAKKAGFTGVLRVSEILAPLDGNRMLEVLRNAWAVFFRWGPLSQLPTEDKVDFLSRSLDKLAAEPDFERWLQETAYHPTAVFTVSK